MRIADQDATCASEVAGLRQLIVARRSPNVENVEQEWAGLSMSVRIAVNLICANTSRREQLRMEAAKAHLEELELVLERVNHGEIPVPAPVTSAPPTPARGPTDTLIHVSWF